MKRFLPILTLLIAVLGVIGTWLKVDEFREYLGLDAPTRTLHSESRISVPAKRADTPDAQIGLSPAEAGRRPTDTTTHPAISNNAGSIRADYDSLKNRFSAVEASLHQRFRDLEGSQIKPEIVGAIADCRTDLAAGLAALSDGRNDVALSRLDRVRRNLKYLESL